MSQPSEGLLVAAYPYLILVGITILAVLFFLWRQARKLAATSLALIRLNESLRYDTLNFIQAAWPLLERAGIHGLAWELEWFGMEFRDSRGSVAGTCLERAIEVPEMTLRVRVHHAGSHSERRYFSQALVETLLLLLRVDMLIKAGTVHATFAQMAKLNLFLQHDMKNIAQYIQLVADQLPMVGPGREARFLDYLRTSVPMIHDRADRILAALGRPSGQPSQRRIYHLAEEIHRHAALHRVPVVVVGGLGPLELAEGPLETALENLFKNYASLAQREGLAPPTVQASLEDVGERVILVVEDLKGKPVADLPRLFEPFWSSDPNGLGIGLYQSRQQLLACGGSLDATAAEDGHLRFALTLPKAVSSSESV